MKGPSDSGRTVFFPGRNGPARPSAAGRSRPPGHSRPFLPGRPAKCETPPPIRTQFLCVGRRFPILGTTCHVCPASSRDRRSDCVPCISPRARACPRAALHHPPVHQGYHPPSRRWRGGCSGAARRCMRFARMPALVPRPHGPSRWCTVFCTASPAPVASALCRSSLLPCGFLSDLRSRIQV